MSSLLLGETFVVEENTGEDSFTRTPGGSMLNVAVALKNLGRTVRIVTDVGRDEPGRVILNYAAAHGIELWLRREEERDIPTTVLRNISGILQPFPTSWDIQDQPESAACKLDLELLAPRTVAFGSASCHLEPGASKIKNWLSVLQDKCTIFYNPKVRKTQLNNIDIIEDFVKYADVVVTSTEDIALIYGTTRSFADIAQHWKTLGPSLVVVTHGSSGAHFYPTSAQSTHIPARNVKVVDPSGAGDTFLAALIDGVTRLSMGGAGNKVHLKTLSLPLIRSLGNYASLASSLTVGRSGITPPTREEIARAITSEQAPPL